MVADLKFKVVPAPDAALLEPGAYCKPMQAVPKVCSFGAPTAIASAGVALIGDSHAMHWRAALSVVAKRRHWRGYTIARNNCAFEYALTTGPGDCHGWSHQVVRWLNDHRFVKTVVVSANATSGVRIPPGETFSSAKINGYRRAWAALPSSVERVIVLRDVPRGGLNTADCVRRALGRRQAAGVRCARDRKVALLRDLQVKAAEQSAQDRSTAFDLTPYMCSATKCFPVVGGALVLRDTTHLTTTFSETLGAPLTRAFEVNDKRGVDGHRHPGSA